MNNSQHRGLGSPGRTILCFSISLLLLGAFFSVLWVMAYEVRWLGALNVLLVPWGWLAGFFLVAFAYSRRRVALPAVFSVYLAVVFSALLFMFIFLVIAPFYDPFYYSGIDAQPTAVSGPRDSAVFAHHTSGAGPLLRNVGRRREVASVHVLSCLARRE